ncbi:hypothetical protein ACFL5E_00925 [Candidatus Omnitrophota bacterium]
MEWWEYYDVKGDLKTLRDEIIRLSEDMEELRQEIEELKRNK